MYTAAVALSFGFVLTSDPQWTARLPSTTMLGERNTVPEATNASVLSARGQQLLAAPPMPEYLTAHFLQGASDPFHPQSNPDGYIGLCVAENRLMWDVLEPRVRASRDVPETALAYDAMIGSNGFRESLANFLSERLLGRTIAAQNIAVLAGAGSVLEILFYTLADPGDAVLIPTPSYAGFWLDLQVRDELVVVPVHGASVWMRPCKELSVRSERCCTPIPTTPAARWPPPNRFARSWPGPESTTCTWYATRSTAYPFLVSSPLPVAPLAPIISVIRPTSSGDLAKILPPAACAAGCSSPKMKRCFRLWIPWPIGLVVPATLSIFSAK